MLKFKPNNSMRIFFKMLSLDLHAALPENQNSKRYLNLSEKCEIPDSQRTW